MSSELLHVVGWLRWVSPMAPARGGRGPGSSVRLEAERLLPPSPKSSIHPSLLRTQFNDVKTNCDAFDAHLLLKFRAATEPETIEKLRPEIRKCAAPASVCGVKSPEDSLVPSSGFVLGCLKLLLRLSSQFFFSSPDSPGRSRRRRRCPDPAPSSWTPAATHPTRTMDAGA